MRKWVSLCCTALVLLLVASCSVPITLEPETESASAERTFVITSHTPEGVATMSEGIEWHVNSLIALQKVGTRSGYAKQLASFYDSYFQQTDRSAFDKMQKVDLGGNDVFLVVPRFDLETLSVFSVAIDSTGKAHILKQCAETNQAFLLFCDTTEKPNAELSIALGNEGVDGKMRIVLRRDEETGALDLPASVQELS